LRSIVIRKSKYFSLSWKDIEKDVTKLAKQISPRPTAIIGIARGGVVIARLLSDLLDMQKIRFFGLRFYKSVDKREKKIEIYQRLKENLKKDDVLLVDDVADTGKSIKVGKQLVLSLKPKDLKIATLYIKPWSNFKPDYFVKTFDGWVIFPWEKNEFIREISKKYTKDEVNKIIKRLSIKE
jgi:hypoxanthine phosphoribosyltransferase